MSATIFHTPLPAYCPPPVSRFAPDAELHDLRQTKRTDRLTAANHWNPKTRAKAQARMARLAELEEVGL